MICSPFEATILWSVGQGDHKTSAWPTTSALEPLWGCAKHTQKHTPDWKKHCRDICTYAHIVYGALADGRIMSFPQADHLCQQPVRRRCVFSSTKSITGSHILRNTNWIIYQKNDSNQQTWANEISSAQSANQTSRINPGKFNQGQSVLVGTSGRVPQLRGSQAQDTKAQFIFMFACGAAGSCSVLALFSCTQKLLGSSPNSWLCSS